MHSVANHPISTRQAEIADLVVSGKSNREIAETLFLSPRTVETHVAALFNKLGWAQPIIATLRLVYLLASCSATSSVVVG